MCEKYLTSPNYTKTFDLASIWNEVLVCREYNIPVENIFETMPLNEKYDVKEDNTWFYDGSDALLNAAAKLSSIYGTSLGVAFHHTRTVYTMDTGTFLARIYPYTEGSHKDLNGQTADVGILYLTSSDGTVIQADLYQSKPDSEFCYLAAGVRQNVEYALTLNNSIYSLKQSTLIFLGDNDDTVFDASVILIEQH